MSDQTAVLQAAEASYFRLPTNRIATCSQSVASISDDAYWTGEQDNLYTACSPESTMVDFDALLSSYSLDSSRLNPNRQFAHNYYPSADQHELGQNRFNQGHQQFQISHLDHLQGNKLYSKEQKQVRSSFDGLCQRTSIVAPLASIPHVPQLPNSGTSSSASASASVSVSVCCSGTASGTASVSAPVQGDGGRLNDRQMTGHSSYNATTMGFQTPSVATGGASCLPMRKEKSLSVWKGDPKSRSEIRRARAARNRSSARRSRLKKKAESERDRERALQIQAKNDALKEEVQQLRQKFIELQRVASALGLSDTHTQEGQE